MKDNLRNRKRFYGDGLASPEAEILSAAVDLRNAIKDPVLATVEFQMCLEYQMKRFKKQIEEDVSDEV
jgi:hypothetical protein